MDYSMILILVVMVAVFYFMIIRPEKKKKKEEENLRNSLKEGDKITTIGGISVRSSTSRATTSSSRPAWTASAWSWPSGLL